MFSDPLLNQGLKQHAHDTKSCRYMFSANEFVHTVYIYNGGLQIKKTLCKTNILACFFLPTSSNDDIKVYC